jgi:hypothetical protein
MSGRKGGRGRGRGREGGRGPPPREGGRGSGEEELPNVEGSGQPPVDPIATPGEGSESVSESTHLTDESKQDEKEGGAKGKSPSPPDAHERGEDKVMFQLVEQKKGGAVKSDQRNVKSWLKLDWMNVVTIERSVKIGLKLAWMNVVTIDKKFQVPVPDMYEFLLDSPSLEKFAAAIEDYGTPLKKDGESLPIVMTIPVHLYLNCTGELFQHLMLWIHFGTALPGHISHEAVKQFSKAYSLKTLEGATHISPDYAVCHASSTQIHVKFMYFDYNVVFTRHWHLIERS